LRYQRGVKVIKLQCQPGPIVGQGPIGDFRQSSDPFKMAAVTSLLKQTEWYRGV